jgi:hypothetical protein
LTGPLLFEIFRQVTEQPITLNRNFESVKFQPDALEFLLPPPHNRWLGQAAAGFLNRLGVFPKVETAVTLPWLSLALAVLAVVKVRGRERPAVRWWALFTLVWVILAIGPQLQVAGRTAFTEYDLPLIMPYAFLTALPGMDFMRTSGRFMQLGYIGLAMTAAWGLAYLLARRPDWAPRLAIAAMALLVVGQWPRPWPTMPFPPVPDFYRQIAGDDERYGILDLPLRPAAGFPADMFSSNYMALQMTHRKGIAMGYLSRNYDYHPVFPCLLPEPVTMTDVLIDGQPADCLGNAVNDLVAAEYRYIVYHRPEGFVGVHRPDAWADQQARNMLAGLLPGQEPLVSDDLVEVYEVRPRPAEELAPAIRLGENWFGPESDGRQNWRWAATPAELVITMPEAQTACLEITPFWFVQSDSEPHLAASGVIEVETAGQRQRLEGVVGRVGAVALDLAAGENRVILIQPGGNFWPGSGDRRWLSLAISQLNLVLGGGC